MAAVSEIRRLQQKVNRLQRRVKALEDEEESADAIGFRMPQSDDDPEPEEFS